MRYVDFALRLGAEGDQGLAEVVEAPGGRGRCSFPLQPLRELGERMAAVERRVVDGRSVEILPRTGPTIDPREVGATLSRSILREGVRDSFRTSLGLVHGRRDRGLRLRLVFDLEQEGAAELAALPWELLHDGDRGFLCQDLRTPVVRYVDVGWPVELPPLGDRLRALMVVLAPADQLPLDQQREEASLKTALNRPGIEMEVLDGPSLADLRRELRRGDPHVLHLSGHAGFEDGDGEARLLFEGADQTSLPVLASQLAATLRGLPSLRLVVLAACDSGRLPRRRGQDPYTGIAAALVRAGVPSAVAMQFPIHDATAITFSHRFYEALVSGDSPDAALTEGRLAIVQGAAEGSLEWVTPALFTRVRTEAVPVSSLQVDVSLAPPAIQDRVLDFSSLVADKGRGFVGRRFASRAVDAFVRSPGSQYLEVVGEPGIGKTALVARLAQDRHWVHHFNIRSAGIFRHESFLSNVCAQLIVQYRLDYRRLPPEATRDAGFLLRLLSEVSDRLSGDERCVLLVDALDEADREAIEVGANPLYLPPWLPERVRVVLCRRPEEERTLPLHLENCHEPLEIDPRSPENLADVREYVATFASGDGIRRYLARHGLDQSAFVEEMVERSEGNFMYLSFVLPAMAAGRYLDRPLTEIPVGLRSYYESHWRRMRGRSGEDVWRHRKLPVLGVMTVLDRPVTQEHLASISNVALADVRQVVAEWRPFLTVTDLADHDGHRRRWLRFYHRSFHDFLLTKDEVADEHFSLRDMDARVAEALLCV